MKFCLKCGKKIKKVFCRKCCCSKDEKRTKNLDDLTGLAWAFTGFFILVMGLILYLILKEVGI